MSSGQAQFERFWVCRCVKSWVRVVVVATCFFRGFSFDTVFANTKWSSSHPPFFCFGIFCFVTFVFGFKVLEGLRWWPHGHLALNPPFFIFDLFIEKHCFPPEKGYFCSFFSVSLSFSLASFTSPSLSLSLSLSSLFSFYLLFFPLLPSLFLFFPSFFCAVFSYLVSLHLIHEKNNIKVLHWKGFFALILSVFWVSCFVLSFKSLLLIFVFRYLKLFFSGQHQCLYLSPKT